MLSTIKKHSAQLGMFSGLADQLDQKHPLYLLSNKIDWPVFEDAFRVHYSEKMGAPAKPIRLMVSLLVLKYLRGLSDEGLMEQWSGNLYYQYLGGEQHFRPTVPCVPTELVAFRQRIGEAGPELVLKESIRVNEPSDGGRGGRTVSVDTTVQEMNITYPTNDKLYKKIIKKCWKMADGEGVCQKRGGSGKVYSLHEPDVKCHAKGKEHKKIEFVSKASILVDQETNIIMGVLNFTEALHDSKTLPEVLEQYERLMGQEAGEVFVDRGYRGMATYKKSRGPRAKTRQGHQPCQAQKIWQKGRHRTGDRPSEDRLPALPKLPQGNTGRPDESGSYRQRP